MATSPISIVIPVYNGAAYLKLAIESALAQTVPACEVAVLDDAATDDTPAVYRPYVQSGRISAHRLDVRKPAPGAWNEAVRRSHGEYVVILAHDDLLDGNFVEEASKALAADATVDVVVTMHRMIDTKGEYISTATLNAPGETYPGVMPAKSYMDRFTRSGQFFLPTAVVMRRATFDRIGGFDEGIKVAYDWDFFLRLGAAARIYVLPQALISYRIHPSQSIQNHVLHDNGDSDVIFDKLPTLAAAFDEQQRQWLVEGMCDFLCRFATRRLRDVAFDPPAVVACRRDVRAKLLAWRNSGNALAQYVRLTPRRLLARIAWHCIGTTLGVRMLRNVLRVRPGADK